MFVCKENFSERDQLIEKYIDFYMEKDEISKDWWNIL